MWKWIRRREWIAPRLATSDRPVAEHLLGIALRTTAKVPGKYAPLHAYLTNRYADSVVLTFGPSVDSGKPPTDRRFKTGHHERAAETSEFYFVPLSVRKSVCSFVRQLRGPHLSTCA